MFAVYDVKGSGQIWEYTLTQGPMSRSDYGAMHPFDVRKAKLIDRSHVNVVLDYLWREDSSTAGDCGLFSCACEKNKKSLACGKV